MLLNLKFPEFFHNFQRQSQLLTRSPSSIQLTSLSISFHFSVSLFMFDRQLLSSPYSYSFQPGQSPSKTYFQ